MKEIQTFDKIFLALTIPLWLCCLGVHLKSHFQFGLMEPGIAVNFSAPNDYPVVRSIHNGYPIHSSPLKPGDRLTRIGDSDLRGAGAFRFFAISQRERNAEALMNIVFLRNGKTHRFQSTYAPSPLPIRFILGTLGYFTIGLLVLVRGNSSRYARYLCRGSILFSFAFLRPFGGPVEITYFGFTVVFLAGSLSFPALIIGAYAFPNDNDPIALRHYIWPYIFTLLGPVYASGVAGVSLAGSFSKYLDPIVDIVVMSGMNVLGIILLLNITRNYRRASALEKRKVRFFIYGCYLALTPIIFLTGISITDPKLWWLSDASEIFHILIPLFVFFGITRVSLFDIDRWISATAAYSLIIYSLLIGIFFLIPPFAYWFAEITTLDLIWSQALLSAGLAALLLPLNRLIRPPIERFLFPERFALKQSVDELVRELNSYYDADGMLNFMGRKLYALIRPYHCLAFRRVGHSFEPVISCGRTFPSPIDDKNPLIAVLSTRSTPLFGLGDENMGIDRFEQAALSSLETKVLLPIRNREQLVAFVAVGAKRSGDVYTTTDLALLSAIATAPRSVLWENASRSNETDASSNSGFGDVVTKSKPSLVVIEGRGELGSGFFISFSGLLLTSGHLIAEVSSVLVGLPDGHRVRAAVEAYDPLRDLGLLRLAQHSHALPLSRSKQLMPGEPVIAMGSPGSSFGPLLHSVTQGIISARRNFLAPNDSSVELEYLQTDAALNRGNSGGPLLNQLGEVVGINTFKDLDPSREGLSFALAIEEAFVAFPQILKEIGVSPDRQNRLADQKADGDT